MNNKLIMSYCKKKGFGYNIFDDRAIITTKLGEVWEIQEDRGRFHVYHVNNSFNPTKKYATHKQRTVNNLTYALQTVGDHDKYDKSLKHNEVFKIKRLLEQVGQLA